MKILKIKFLLTAIIFCCVTCLFAQKQVIDSVASKEWPLVGFPTINNTGKYTMYFIQNMPVGSRTLVIQSTDGKWKIELSGRVKDGQTVLSSEYLFFINNNDSLGRLTLGTSIVKYTNGVSSCWIKETRNDEYLFYTSGDREQNLIVRNLKTNKDQCFTNVRNSVIDENRLVLFKSDQRSDQKQSIDLADLTTGKISTIWEGNKAENVVEDIRHHQLAFKTGDSVWHYRIGSGKPNCMNTNGRNDADKGLIPGALDHFSKDGKCLFASLVAENKAVKTSKAPVEIWSYTDISLPTEPKQGINPERCISVINVDDHKITRWKQEPNEQFQFPILTDHVALVEDTQRAGELWSQGYRSTWSLVFPKNGQRKTLNFLGDQRNVKLSPCGKFLIYFNALEQNYYSYEIQTEKIRNITKGLDVSWIDLNIDDVPRPRGISNLIWLTNDESVLIFDQYDLWEVDPLNRKAPVNLTKGYGKRNHIVFNYPFTSYQGDIIDKNKKLYLSAFNKETKDNGFYSIDLNNGRDPKLLSMGPYLYQTNSPYAPRGSDFTPLKANNEEMYLVRGMSATDAPNYFSTRDFKSFIRLSDLQPQKNFNWYTSELHQWKSLDGRILQGILYKPENFDPGKKYPVIFHYYERMSDGLNSYLTPEPLTGGMNINIPNYVSNGYLVFCPDIYYKIGDPMQGTYDAVVSAAKYISNFSFINVKKMGMQGGSFGGFQTNYLITHTNLFAAATSSSGVADWVSSYGGLVGGEGSTQNYFETDGQGRIGGSLWEKPESYIKNSSIFRLDKVTTPLLMMHTKNDGICLYPNAIEFFTGLRRMGKKAWMLVYEGDHGIGGKDAEDFSLRMMQFFDHYLKDKPSPMWMLGSVPGTKGETNNGLKLDTIGRTPGPGLLTPGEQKKVDSMMNRKPITIRL